MDPITIALQIVFYVLFAMSVWQYVRHRGALELSVVAIFGSFAALFFLTFLNALLPEIAPIARPILVAVLFAQPYLVLRLITQIRPVSRARMLLALVGAVAAWAAIVVLPLAIPDARQLGTVLAVLPTVGLYP